VVSPYTRPDWVRRLAVMGPSIGDPRELVALDADGLITAACRSTGLDDFGAPTWEEPFRRLVAALDTEAELHVLGRLLCRHDLLRHLSTRLRVVDAVEREPAVADEQVLAPVVVTGPARSGTSILQELLAQDPQLRGPLAWEMAHPIPPPGDDHRAEWAESEFDLWGDIQPEFRAIHELQATLPEECLWLLAPEFDTGFWSTCTQVTSWFAWRAGTDPGPAYRFHRTMLQLLQHRSPAQPRTWALKSPVHLSRLPALFATYPDARVIHTHRDPVKTVPSAASTVFTGRWLRSDAVDPVGTGQMIGFGFEMILNGVAAARDGGGLPEAQIADLHYLDLLRDPVAALEQVYDRLGLPFGPDLPDRFRGYLDRRPQHKHGVHRYDAAEVGLATADLRTRFRPYMERFGVEAED
jgi:hypothetical protein